MPRGSGTFGERHHVIKSYFRNSLLMKSFRVDADKHPLFTGNGDFGYDRTILNCKQNSLANYGSLPSDSCENTTASFNHEDHCVYEKIFSIRVIFVCAVLVSISLIDVNVRRNVSRLGSYLRTHPILSNADRAFFLYDDNDNFSSLVGNRSLESALLRDNLVSPEPFSTLDPVKDLHLQGFSRTASSSPPRSIFGRLSEGIDRTRTPLPTNKWYENMLLVSDEDMDPSINNRAYTVPYVVDAVGPIPGLRLFGSRILAMQKIVQVSFDISHGLTIGSASNLLLNSNISADNIPRRYQLFDDYSGDEKEKASAYPLTPLGLTLKWEPIIQNGLTMMTSSIVRGMPYGTMHYHWTQTKDGDDFSHLIPTVASEEDLLSPPVIDSTYPLYCSNGSQNETATTALVQNSVLLSFAQSDFSWLVFYSRPVYVRCYVSVGSIPFVLQVTGLADSPISDASNKLLTSRIALVNNCTKGTNPSYCFQAKPNDRTDYSLLLHKHAHIYPGKDSKIDYTFFSDEILGGGTRAYLQFDWDPRDYKTGTRSTPGLNDSQLLMYSLPHHRDRLRGTTNSPNKFLFDDALHCTSSLNGRACIVEGSNWVLEEELDEEPSFYAPRRPNDKDLPVLAEAISQDIHFELPAYYVQGAGDTYFSGKMLAKLARIIMITKELMDICSPINGEAPSTCDEIELPSENVMNDAISRLKKSTEVWINGSAVTPFVYDSKWGGLVSCGCYFDETQGMCRNQFPECPSFDDHGLDFGHGFFNDHHFHHGYHIYAAAAVSYLDQDWGKKHFEYVLVLIRDIANPSIKDSFFPTYRMKDWYLGNSWAGGIANAYPNGRNQESSSESIAAYEAIALYGKIMADVWENAGVVSSYSRTKTSIARHIRDVGRLLTATELRSADRYWHVRQDRNGDDIYPIQYEPHVVGIMWNMMAQFQTWFGSEPHLVYGIQLMPLTPVAERRDDPTWLQQLYSSFEASCAQSNTCEEEGWGILLNSVLATCGHRSRAVRYAVSLNSSVFESAGGNGHSRTNTIWYYSTRPVTISIPLPNYPNVSSLTNLNGTEQELDSTIDCGCPESCSDSVLELPAGGYTCGMRIKWLIKYGGKSQREACEKVARYEFPKICSGCNPTSCQKEVEPVQQQHITCPPCDIKTCTDHLLNRCPILDAPYLCVEGTSMGGCSAVPWKLGSDGGMTCNACCLLTSDCEKAAEFANITQNKKISLPVPAKPVL